MGRLFGTNGIRGTVNEEMTAELALGIGRAVATIMEGPFAVASDSRTTGAMIKNAVISGILSSGKDVVDMGILSTPALQYSVKTGNYGGGIVITASHNPPHFNGIKCIDSDGTELDAKKEEKIEEIYFNRNYYNPQWDKTGRLSEDFSGGQTYIKGIASLVDKEITMKKKLKVIVDCSNGAACLTAPYLYEKLGCHVISVNSHPQGTFPGHESEPTPENLATVMSMVKAVGADLGIVHDGDADRTVFIDETGAFISGDKSFSVLVKYILEKTKGRVITPVSSSMCIEDSIVSSGGEIIYTKVGSPIVARKMMETDAVFGGEENGGLIFPEFQYCRDGAMTAAKMIELLSSTEFTLSELVAQVPKYYTIKKKIPCPEKLKDFVMNSLKEKLKNEDINTLDGIRINTKNGWAIIRPSGTEPIYRVFAEAKNEIHANELIEKFFSLLKGAVDEASEK